MGFQLGPKLLRRPPKGWLPARAFAEAYRFANDHGADHGESVIDTSHSLSVTWRVEADGRAPWEVSEARRVPVWTLGGGLGGGNRWYKLRLRSTGGFVARLGVPCRFDPADPQRLWIDWDAAHAEHVEAWEQEGRVERELARRDGRWDHAFHRVLNPFDGRLQDGDEAIVEEVARRRDRRERELVQQASTPGFGPALPGEIAEQRRRIDELGRLKREGRQVRGRLLRRSGSDRELANVPVLELTFELLEETGPREVVFEHVFGERHANRYRVGREIDVWVDRDDPERIFPED